MRIMKKLINNNIKNNNNQWCIGKYFLGIRLQEFHPPSLPIFFLFTRERLAAPDI